MDRRTDVVTLRLIASESERWWRFLFGMVLSAALAFLGAALTGLVPTETFEPAVNVPTVLSMLAGVGGFVAAFVALLREVGVVPIFVVVETVASRWIIGPNPLRLVFRVPRHGKFTVRSEAVVVSLFRLYRTNRKVLRHRWILTIGDIAVTWTADSRPSLRQREAWLGRLAVLGDRI